VTADDVLAIHNLIADYVFCIDERDLVGFERLWTPDAVFRLVRDPVGLGAPLHGRAAIVAGFTAFFAREGGGEPGSFTRHLCGNPRIGVVDGQVRAKTGLVSVRQELDGDRVVIHPSRTGVYRDRIVHESGRWRFAERELAWDPPERDGVDLPAAVYGARL
jgi:ketosteroid isomerase-like protein